MGDWRWRARERRLGWLALWGDEGMGLGVRCYGRWDVGSGGVGGRCATVAAFGIDEV